MKKNKLVLLLAAVLIVFSGGCTSSETPEDEQQVENADIEKIETIDGSEEPKPTESADTTTTAADEASLEASLNEPAAGDTAAAPTDTATAPAEETTTSVASSDPAPTDATAPTVDEKSLNASADAPPPVTDAQLAPDPSLATSTETAPAPAVTEAPSTENTTSFSSVEPTPVAKPSGGGVSMKKVTAIMPYQAKDGGWVNTVYIARPGEKLADISMKIFGADKTKEIKGIAENSYLKSRSVRPGDKIYYVSPNRPDDSSRTILYYEDMGMVPETYVAKKGESLRKVSKELLGYDNAWKEIWSTNGVESKTSLKDGETLRYWKAGAETMVSTPPMPPPTTAGADVTTQPPVATATMEPPPAAPPADASGALPSPPPDAAASMPPPPADPNAVAATAPPPPPGDDASAAAPPPPPAVEEPPPADAGDGAVAEAKGQKKLDEEAEAEEEAEGLNSDTLMSMGALGVLLGLLAFVIIRKKKQKSQMNNLEMNA